MNGEILSQKITKYKYWTDRHFQNTEYEEEYIHYTKEASEPKYSIPRCIKRNIQNLDDVYYLNKLHSFLSFRGIYNTREIYKNNKYYYERLIRILESDIWLLPFENEIFADWQVYSYYGRPHYYFEFTENVETNYTEIIYKHTKGMVEQTIKYLEYLLKNHPSVYNQCVNFVQDYQAEYDMALGVARNEYIEKIKKYIKDNPRAAKEKSSYEWAVSDYLQEMKIPFKTEYNTQIVCINSKTNRQLPYDFELVNYKVIIEVHGEQHYKYIPHFHKSKEDFLEKQKIDRYKKEFALNNGYKYLELRYEDFKDNTYKEKIKSIIW